MKGSILNLLVSKHYTVTDHTKWPGDRSHEGNLVENYKAMSDLMVASARKNLIGLDDVVVHTGEADNIRDVFRIHFYEIYELWKQGHNILYADSDVIFTKPYDYFSKFDKFVMFNYTDGGQKGTTCNHYNVAVKHFYNCGIRYYPQTMSQDIWDIGLRMCENWNPNRWNSEQLIYNVMMWSQQFDQHFYRPDLAYQAVSGDTAHNDRFNGIPLNQAHAVHFHGSRGSSNRLDRMRAVSERFVNTDTIVL